MALIWGAVIAGAAGLAGSAISSATAQGDTAATNAANANLNQQNMDWQTQMSDTAMQRRVTDLKAAGLNPLLAVGQGGASTPGFSPIPMQSAAVPQSQAINQGAGSVASAAQGYAQQQAQIDNLKAQTQKALAEARNTDSNTDTVIPAQVQQIQSQIGLNVAQATNVQRNIQLLDISLQQYGPEGQSTSMAQIQAQEKTAQAAIQTRLMQMDAQERSDTLLTLIRARNNSNFAAAIGASNIANANDTAFGRLMSYFHLGQPAISTAVDAAKVGAMVAP